jgi:Kae1-associated kinase Bud32
MASLKTENRQLTTENRELKTFAVIAQGAEAVIRTDRITVVKERIPKSYRHSEIDERLRKSRTRREARIIGKINSILPSPKLISADEYSISMDFIDGQKLRDVLEKSDYKKLCRTIGAQLAVMHNNDIVHGDLTTSNMILKDNKIFFIDFGLSFQSSKIEDRAVDLWLMKQAFESKHYTISSKCFEGVIEGYKGANDFSKILNRLKEVELRGRNKKK